MEQIHIHFPLAGEWDRFEMTAIFADGDGFMCREHYDQRTVPAEVVPTLTGIIGSLTGLEEPWRATHVVANYRPYEPAEDEHVGEDDEVIPAKPEVAEAVLLTVDARRKSDRATRQFTEADYPQLELTDAGAIAVFKTLTHMD